MLLLRSISLLQFKNYSNQSFDFSERIVGICGNNGVGKTNLLDAIHYLSLTKSAISASDALCIKQGADFFVVKGVFSTNSAAAKPVRMMAVSRLDLR